jgi:pimeloyl-ACP methyl ester carboxylesterase
MTFDQVRSLVLRKMYRARLEQFVTAYKPGHPVVILLPGCLGSKLDRSQDAFPAGDYREPAYWDTVWLDPGMFGDDLLSMEIRPGGEDAGDRLVVAEREFAFLVLPYFKAVRDLSGAGCNLYVFPYDWRRSIRDAAWWLRELLAEMAARVAAEKGESIDGRVVLLGHSMGGMVSKMFLTQHEADALKWVGAMVSAGSPFWGFSTLQRAFFEGKDPFNWWLDAARVARLLASMPGCYEVFYSPRAVWTNGTTAHRELPAQYPIEDGLDPYDDPVKFRWDHVVRDALLAEGRKSMALLHQPLPPALAARVHHFRGRGKATDGTATWSEAKQRWVFRQDVDGDDSVPHWSARLAGIPDAQVRDVFGYGHQQLLQSDDVLDFVLSVGNQAASTALKFAATRVAAAPVPERLPRARLKTLAGKNGTARFGVLTTERQRQLVRHMLV